jgi:hypothetical protein
MKKNLIKETIIKLIKTLQLKFVVLIFYRNIFNFDGLLSLCLKKKLKGLKDIKNNIVKG